MTQNTKDRQNTSEKKVKKGDFGYFQSEKKRKLIITAILFAVPLFIFFTSWIYFKTRISGGADHDPEMQTYGQKAL